MLVRLLPVFRKFLGGCPGRGLNWLSWVHLHDLIGAIKFLMERPEAQGAFNLTAPNPVRAKYFYQLLGEVLRRPVLMPMPAFILKLLLGDMARDLLLAGQKTLPKKLLGAGYQFRHSELESALRDILRQSND